MSGYPKVWPGNEVELTNFLHLISENLERREKKDMVETEKLIDMTSSLASVHHRKIVHKSLSMATNLSIVTCRPG